MAIIKQISVFIGNESGRLAEVTGIIAANNINIRALSVADTSHFGIMRCIVDDPELTERVLKDAGVLVSVTSVISVQIPDEPGGLAKVLSVLAENGINVEYIYAFISKEDDKAFVAMRIEEEFRALQILKDNGYEKQ